MVAPTKEIEDDPSDSLPALYKRLAPAAPAPPRLFQDPSESLAVLYENLDDTLVVQAGAADKWVEARRDLEEAKRRMAEAENSLRACAEDVRAATEEMREAELVEPCPWNDMLDRLRKFRDEHGHTDLTHPHHGKAKSEDEAKRRNLFGGGEDGMGGQDDLDNIFGDDQPDLSDWVESQRQSYKEGTGTLYGAPHRVRALEQLGVVWDKREVKWAAMYRKLLSFKERHGHANVSRKFSPDEDLLRWAALQKETGRAKMKPERLLLLEEVGFKWKTRQHRKWEESYADLCAYRGAKGHCDVPNRYAPNPKLGNWVYNQRKAYSMKVRGVKGGESLTAERIRMLEDVGFQWRCSRERTREHKMETWIRNKRGRYADGVPTNLPNLPKGPNEHVW